MTHILKSTLIIGVGLMLIAASSFDMQSYWSSPQVTSQPSHDWSALEKNMRPEACAQCHESQFNDWKQSLHAEAYSPGLVGQFPDMGHFAGNDCLRCHAPLEEQLYSDQAAMIKSLNMLKENPKGIDDAADLESKQAHLPLRHSGVSCAVCHVRNGTRFGPPRQGSQQEGHIATPAHGGFIASKKFEQANFCAECHQFPQSYAINGKPLENTITEWQQSRFARQGKQCQSCHMPDRKHKFKGIHDQQFTRKGLGITVYNKSGIATLSLTSKNIGHAFPTYVTPKVIIQATALNPKGETLKTWQWEIVREVFYNNGWKEKRDTRLLPGKTRVFMAKHAPQATVQVSFQIKVVPDQFYKGVYQNLLQSTLSQTSHSLIKRALTTAEQRDYLLFSEVLNLKE